MNKRQSSTKQALLDCAANLLQERGYHGWSYEDISKSVGLKKATIHYYFPKKEDLGRELIVQYNKKTMEYLDSQENKDKNPQEQLMTIVDLFASVLENPNMFCLCGMLAADLPTLAPGITKELTNYFEKFETYVENIFKMGETQKYWICSQSPAFEAKSLIASFQGMLLLSRMQGGKNHFIQMAKNYISKLKSV